MKMLQVELAGIEPPTSCLQIGTEAV